MYNEPVFLKPAFQERIWGGNKLQQLFNYDIPTANTGEAWVISAHENGPSIVLNGALQGKTLTEVWKTHPELFGLTISDSEFPLLIKILDANDDLSVQVHPNDKYALEMAGKSIGKTECWYILDCDEGAEIIFGHKAKTHEEFKEMVANGEWQNLFQSVKVKKGDFVYVPSGTIHAIGKGIVILETQQNSDITYRLYDYDRIGTDGKKRQLHLNEAVTVASCPHQEVLFEKLSDIRESLASTKLIEEQFFTVYHWLLDGKIKAPISSDFLLVSVIDGEGWIETEVSQSKIKKGDNFIVPATIGDYFIEGHLELIVSHN